VKNIDQRRFDNPPSVWLSAREAAKLLGVKLQTLYAYASRGLVRSARGERGRPRRYLRDDVLRLKARHDARAGHGAVAASALRWGEPVLDSALTMIGPRGPCYRGHCAVDLASADIPFEAVAELLWVDAPLDRTRRWEAVSLGTSAAQLLSLVEHAAPHTATVGALLAALAARDPAAAARGPAATVALARRVIPRIAAVLGLSRGPAHVRESLRARSVGAIVARALGASASEAGEAINRALVVLADHELNASSFAARVTASAGADLCCCLLAATATLSGPLHGGMSAQVETLVAEAGTASRAKTTVRARMARGESVPGFGHPLYPHGDPRTQTLLDLAHAIAPSEARLRTLDALVDAAGALGLGAATLDIGLVALAYALRLPPGSPVGIFAVGRSAGWTAHSIEQHAAGFLLRPRARYVGRPSLPAGHHDESDCPADHERKQAHDHG
jgi:citrate synthase